MTKFYHKYISGRWKLNILVAPANWEIIAISYAW